MERLRLFLQSFKPYFFGAVCIVFAFSYIVIELADWTFYKYLTSFVILFFILFSLKNLKGTSGKITALLMVLTILLLFDADNVFSAVMEGARVNLTLVTIFILTPLLGITVRTGGYVEDLKIVLQKLRNNAVFFYISTACLTHMLGVVLNIGSVSINHYLTSVSNVRSARLIANALNRGFATTIFWSPYFSAMALIVGQLKIAWASIVLYLLGYAVLSLAIGFLLELREMKKEKQRIKELIETDHEPLSAEEMKKVYKKNGELVFLLIATMALVLLLERFPPFSMVLSICFVALIFPLVWCALKGNLKEYRHEVNNHLTKTLPGLRQEITLFLTAGLFSGVFVHSPWSGAMAGFFNSHFGHSPVFMTFAISLAIICTAIIGLHPIISITIFATGIDPALIGLTREHFAIMLLASWGISVTVSPATAVNHLLAVALKKSVVDISLKWNWKYAAILIFLLPFYLQLLNV